MKRFAYFFPAALALVLCYDAHRAAGQYTFTAFDQPGTDHMWTSNLWQFGTPPTSSQTGLLRGGGTMTIDVDSTATTPAGLLIGWGGSFNMVMTAYAGTLTVGNTHGDGGGAYGLTVGESSGLGTFTQFGGAVVAPVVNLARHVGNPSGTYRLNGGTLETGLIRRGSGSGTATLNLNGGTLRATQSNGGWIAPGIGVNVQAGGAVIDTQNFDVTVLSPLLDGGGGGGLTMSGSTTPTTGVLRLGAASTYTGPTNVNAGYLVTNVNYALPATTVLNLNSVGGAVSRLDLMNTTQKIAGLTSVASPGGTVDIYSGGGTAGVLEVDVADGNTYIYYGAVGNSLDGGNRGFKFVKSGQGTQVLRGQLLHTGGTQVAGGALQIGNNDGWNYVGAAGHQYTVDNGAELVFYRNFVPTDFTSQSITGEGDVVFRGQKDGYFRFVNTYSGSLSYTGKTIVNLDTGGAEWYMGYLFLERDNVLPNATVVDLKSGKIDLRNQTVNGLTIAGLQGSAGTSITATGGVGQKLNVDVADGNTYTYAGTIQGGITVTKSGLGTQVLTGTNTYTGTTTIAGGALAIGGSGSLASAVNLSATGAVLDISGLTVDSTGIGSLAGIAGSSVVLGSKRLVAGANNATTGFAGGISGGGGLTKTGTGTLTLSGANTYTGGTLVDMGFLQLDADNAMGSGVLSFGGATARASLNMNGRNQTVRGLEAPNAAQFRGDVYNNAGNLTSTLTIDTPVGETYVYANQIGAVPGWLNVAVVKRGPGTQVFTGNNNYTGETTIAEGTLEVGGGGWVPNSIVNHASLVYSRNVNTVLTGAAGNVAISGTGNVTFSMTVGGYYSIQGGQSYTGSTIINMTGSGLGSSFFVEGVDNALPVGTVVDIVAGNVYQRSGNQTIAGLTGVGTWNGDLAGTHQLTINVASGSHTYGGVLGQTGGGVLALTKSGLGTQVITGNNTYSGGTTIAGGTLQFGDNSASGVRPPGLVTLQNGANLALSHNYDYAGLTMPNVTGDGNLVLLGQGSGYYSIQPGTTQFNYTGTTTLQLDSQSGGTWRGALFVEPGSVGLPTTTVLNIVSGKLDLRQDQKIAGLTGTGGFVTTDGGFTPTLILDFDSSAGPFTYEGVIGRPPETGYNTAGIALEKRGTGTQILSGTNNYTGATTVAGGTLAVNGSLPATSTVTVQSGGTLGGTGTVFGPVAVQVGGALAPGMSVGTLNLGGSLSFEQGGFFDVDIEGVNLADLVQMDGGLLDPNGATIRVNLGFDPELGSSWTILQGEGSLDSLFNPTVDMLSGAEYLDGWKWFEVGYGNSVYLTLVPEPGTWLLLLSALACGLAVRRPR